MRQPSEFNLEAAGADSATTSSNQNGTSTLQTPNAGGARQGANNRVSTFYNIHTIPFKGTSLQDYIWLSRCQPFSLSGLGLG